jgi:hypothetical protein
VLGRGTCTTGVRRAAGFGVDLRGPNQERRIGRVTPSR